MKKEMKKFQETHNWSEYVLNQKHKRVKKLRDKGVLNAWSVVNYQAEPLKNYIRTLHHNNEIVIPKKYVEKFGFKKGDKFEIFIENENIILKHIKSNALKKNSIEIHRMEPYDKIGCPSDKEHI